MVFGGIYISVKGMDIVSCLCGTFKGGYWFTLVLFVFILVQTLTDCVAARLRIRNDGLLYAATLLCLALFLYLWSVPAVCARVEPVGGILSMRTWQYYFYFAAGHLIRIHLGTLLRFKRRDTAVTVVVLLFVILGLGAWTQIGIPFGSGLLFHLRHIALVTTATLSVFFLFYRHRALFDTGSMAARAIAFTGRRTLDIYMLHYFLLPADLVIFGKYFDEHHALILELLFAGALTVAIAAACLLISELLRSSKTIEHWLLCGR